MTIEMGSDLQVTAATMAGEARGDIKPDEIGVGCVIRNRAVAAQAYVAAHGKRHPLYGDGSYAAACLAPWQFDCWNKNDPNLTWIYDQDWTGGSADPAVINALQLAQTIIDGSQPDITNGATSYKTTALPWPSAWGPEVDPVAVLGEQSFYILT